MPGRLLQDARGLERRRRILQLDRARARNLFRDPREQRRFHRVARNRRIVLDDDLDVDRLGQRVVVADDGFGVQLRHPRRADHDGGGAGGLRGAAVGDAGARPFRGRPGDDADAAVHVTGDDLEHALTLAIVQAGHLAGHAERGDAVDARANEEIDDPAQAVVIDLARSRKWRRQNRIDSLELQRWNLLCARRDPPAGPATSATGELLIRMRAGSIFAFLMYTLPANWPDPRSRIQSGQPVRPPSPVECDEIRTGGLCTIFATHSAP